MTRTICRFTLVLTMALFISSCKDDPCEDVQCQNGFCNNGECDCAAGFEGAFCETQVREKIIGGFDISTACQQNYLATDYWAVGALSDAFDEVLINNFHFPAKNIRVKVVDEQTLLIEEQELVVAPDTFNVVGSGVIEDDGRFVIDYTLSGGNLPNAISCSAEAVRQE